MSRLKSHCTAVLILALFIEAQAAWGTGEEKSPVRLQCDGEFADFVQKVQGLAVKGMFLEVRADTVMLSGAIGFDGIYPIVTRKEDGIGFRSSENSHIEGFFGRYSGQFNISEKTVVPAGAYQFKRLLQATCKNAQPLF